MMEVVGVSAAVLVVFVISKLFRRSSLFMYVIMNEDVLSSL